MILKYIFYVCLIIVPAIQDVESLKLTVSQRALLIPRGGRGTIECTPEGFPLPSVQWTKSGETYLRNGVTQNGNTLIITDARDEDRGHYVCQGTIEGNVVLSNYTAVEIGNPPARGNVKVSVSAREVVIPRGGRGTIDCTPEGYPLPKVQWVKSDGEFRNGVSQSGNTLIITDARDEDRGHYVCRAIVDGTAVWTSYSKVEIGDNVPSAESPKIEVSVDELKIVKGQTGAVTCTPGGYPLPRVQWLKHDGTFGAGTSQDGNKLTIANAQEADAGYYVCAGIVGSDEVDRKYVTVEIEEPPAPGNYKLVVSQQQVVIPRGGSGSIECTPEGYPLPRVNWKKADGEFRNGVSQRGNTLIITDARDEDEANYVCEAIVDGTVVLTNYSQVHLGANTPPQENPYVAVSNDEVKIVKGQSVSIICSPGGYPLPRIQWTKHDGKFGAGTSQDGNKLTIENAQEADGGYYVCLGIVGSDEVDSKYVNVEIEAPVPGNYKLIVSQQVVIPRGGSGTIECTPEGYPLPRVNWKKADGEFRDGVSQRGNTLIITDARDEDEANYVCEAIVDGTVVLTNYSQVHLGATETPTEKPYVVLSDEQVKIVKGQNVSIACRAGGYPLPRVQWTKHDGKFGAGTSQNGNTLTISNAQETDAGYYVCVGVVGSDEVDSKYVYVEIEEPAPGNYKLVVSQQQVVIPRGGSGSIECTPEGYPLPRVNWKKADGEFRDGVSQRGNTLIIIDARDEDEANYVCEAIVDGTVVLTSYSQVHLGANPPPTETPYVVLSNDQVTIVKGQSTSITCSARGYPLPRIQWTKHADEFGAGTSQNGDTLSITNAQETDAGYYVCAGIVGSDEVDSKYVSVVIEEPPAPGNYKLVVSQQQVVIPRGANGTIECTPEGYPLPRVNWKKADSEFRDGVSQRGNTLIITDARDEDEANYVCEAIVDGTVVLTNYSQVHLGANPSAPPPENPYVVLSNKQVKIVKGQSAFVTCSAGGYPLPRVRWTKHDGEFGAGTSQNGDTLSITNAQETDGGYYVCVGIGGSDEVDSKYVLVEIEAPTTPQPPQGNPRVAVSERQLRIARGGRGTIECTPAGNPLPTVQWRKSDGDFRNGVSQSGNTLIITDARDEDRGHYVCNGVVDGTVLTTDYASVDVETPTTPQPPQGNPRVAVSERQLRIARGGRGTIECTPAGNPLPTVQWRKSDGDFRNGVAQSGNTLIITDARDEDRGHYVCNGVVDGTVLATDYASVDVETPTTPQPPQGNPRVAVSERQLRIARGGRGTIECTPAGNPLPTVQWRKSDGDFRNGVSQSGNTLIITDARDEDRGHYVCNGVVDGTVLTTDYASVDVESPPTSPTVNNSPAQLIAPIDVVVLEGTDYSIGCDFVTGDIEHVVTWARRDQRPFSSNTHQAGRDLVLRRASQEDNGEYLCLVTASHGGFQLRQTSVRLQVLALPRVSTRPPIQTVSRGQAVAVECVVEGGDGTQVTWDRVDKPMSSLIQYQGSTLTFNSIEVEDAGFYRCSARNSAGLSSGIAQIIVQGGTSPPPPSPSGTFRVAVSHRQLTIARGGSGSIECTPEGNPLPRVTWIKSDGEFRNGVTQNGNTLIISGARDEDRGHYVCQGIVDGTVMLTNYSAVDIGNPPAPGNFKLTVSEQQLTIPRGGRAAIECTPEGYPLPTVQWRKADGTEFRNGVSQSGNTLIITDARDEDRGHYVCNGVVDGTVVLTSYSTVNIGNPPTPAPGNYKLILSERQLIIPRGRTGSVDCTPEGYPLPRVHWIKANGVFRDGVTQNGNTLIITDARDEDRAHYACQAIVDGTVVLTNYTTIEIGDETPPAEIVLNNPKVTVSQRQLAIPRGGQGSVECTPGGYPLPRVQWIKADGDLPNGVTQNGNTLIITDARDEDRGHYVCQGIVDGTVVVTSYSSVDIRDDERPQVPGTYRVQVNARHVKIPRGGKKTVECIPEGYPLPTIKWSKHDDEFGAGARQIGNSLVISNVRDEDAGYYVCDGVVNGTSVWRDYFHLEIESEASKAHTFLGYPRVTVSVREVKIPRGGRMAIECSPEGSPLPTIQWSKDPGEFGAGTKQEGNALVISDAQDADQGVYVCSAVVEGNTVFSDYLSVQIENICSLPVDTGRCRAVVRRWFYDSTQQQCRQFNYGGCQGNKNNFETQEQCSLQCEGTRR